MKYILKICIGVFITLVVRNACAQTQYLDLTGLSSTTSISTRAIGSTGITFNANITQSDAPPEPTVGNDGNVVLMLSSAISQQCIHLSFSSTVQVNISHNSVSPGTTVLNDRDSMYFDNPTYTLTDPFSRFTMTSSGGLARLRPDTSVTNYTGWNVQFATSTTLVMCALRAASSPAINAYVPFRIGISSAALPITLEYFRARQVSNDVLLTWQTLSEHNNAYFQLERSSDGYHWNVIAQLQGAGNSKMPISYQWTDKQSLHCLSYYRLKQVDESGMFSYSAVETINWHSNEKAFLCLYPNPATDFLTVQGTTLETAFTFINCMGNDVSALIRLLSSNQNIQTFDISQLPWGVYVFKSSTNTLFFSKQ